MSIKIIESGTVADAYLALLADRGIDCLFANAGTDFAPIIEAYAKAQVEGTKVPKPITVPHENVAIAMAQGYYLKTGRPQAVMVHVNVGTANALCGIINGWRGNIPVLFTAGRTPYSEEGGLMGMRGGEIHWPQEMRDQRAMVREFVKWDYELPNGETMEAAVDRALNIAMSEPMGPVYLTLPRETLAAPIKNFRYASPSRHATPSPAFPDKNAIDRAADMLAAAEFPLIITRAAGRVETDVAKLAAVAERFAIPVFERKHHYMSMPWNSPMHLGSNPESYFDAADVIVVLEADVPWVPKRKAPRPDCKIIHIGADPLFENYPLRGFPCDLAITGVLGASLPALTDALATREKAASSRIEARRCKVAEARDTLHTRIAANLEKAKNASTIHPGWINHCIDRVKGEDGIVVKEALTPSEHLHFNKPGTFYSLGQGGALGWGLGTALGMKAAMPDRLVICAVGDGSYMFGNPIAAHYVGKAEKLPTLTVIYNNEMWNAVRRNTRDVYPDGYAAKSNHEPLTYFEPGTRYEKTIETVGGYGERVENAAALPKALDRALDAVAGGQQALLNVICGTG
ncbi:MAG TPA: thiamine pyrophosphate-requiring protein [Micropepsaceae bacterium]